MRRSILPLFCAAAALVWSQPSGIEGSWTATLQFRETIHRVVLKVDRTSTGLQATMRSAAQGALEVPVDKITLEGDRVRFQMASSGASFDGAVSADRTAIEGTLTQGALAVSIAFQRGDASGQAGAASSPLTSEERDFLLTYLETTRKAFADSLARLSEAQWRFKPGPNRWSIAECAEHVVTGEKFLYGFASQSVLKAPPPPVRENLRALDSRIIQATVNRSVKAAAIPPLVPTGRFPNAAATLDAFEKARAGVTGYVKGATAGLRLHALPDQQHGYVDAYQSLLIMAAHTMRHVAQIEEIRASPGFPK